MRGAPAIEASRGAGGGGRVADNNGVAWRGRGGGGSGANWMIAGRAGPPINSGGDPPRSRYARTSHPVDVARSAHAIAVAAQELNRGGNARIERRG